MAHSGKTMTFATDLVPQEDNIYRLGNDNQRWKIYGNIQPIASKSYPAYTCSGNNANKGVLFFGKINITDYDPWQTPWSIHYRMYITTSNANMQGWYDCHFSIQGSTVTWYNYNNFYSTSYRPIYHHRLLYPKSGYSQYGGYFGVRVQSANEVTTTARIYKIEVLETKNCTIELLPAIKRFDEVYITTNNIAASTIWYSTDYNGTDVGLQEQGDANSNTYDRTYINNNKKARVAITTGSICVGNSEGYAGIDNGVEFDIAYPILYQPNAIAANGVRSDFYIYYPSITSTVNTTGLTHVANGILYMTGTLSGNTFTCNSKILTYTQPTSEDGIIYIPVAINTNATTQSLYFLGGIAHMYWYKNGAFREYSEVSEYALSAPLSGISGADDLKAIEALSGTGLLKKTAENTWTLDANSYITSYTETDPTVPAWAKAASKPSYTASEVGALPSSTVVTNVKISADTTTNKNYALVFGTTPSDGTTPTGEKTEGLQKNITKLYVNQSTGNIQETTCNSLTLTAAATGFTIVGGTTSKTLTVAGTATINAPTQWGIVYGGASGAYTSTAAGSSGQYLKSNGNAAPTWASFSASTVGLGNVTNEAQIPKSIGTAKGDIIYFDGSASPKRLAIGTSGQVLKVASGIPSWGTDNNDDTKNTAGSTNSTDKLFLVGAKSQDNNPQTYSYQYTYTSNGLLSSTYLGLNDTGNEKVRLAWNDDDSSLNFIFA